jgi:hypothetical protein
LCKVDDSSKIVKKSAKALSTPVEFHTEKAAEAKEVVQQIHTTRKNRVNTRRKSGRDSRSNEVGNIFNVKGA